MLLKIPASLIASFALAVLVAGCSAPVIYTDVSRTTASSNETPVASNFPTTTQMKLQASQHWLNIANDTALAVVELLNQPRSCRNAADPCKMIYVKPADVVTEFSRAFHNQLITTLVKQGLSVSKAPETELTVEMDVQPILFAPNRPQYRYAGVPVQLGPGIWGLRDVASVSPADKNIVPPEDDALHWFRSEFATGQTPQTEILVTVSIGDRRRYLSRVTNAYYIADADRRLYDQELCSLYKLCPASSTNQAAMVAKPKPPSNVAIDVVGDCSLDACVDRDVNAGSKKPKSAKMP